MKKAMIVIAVGTFAFCLTFLNSCKHEPQLSPDPGPDTTIIDPPEDTNICFERDILPIFQLHCAIAGCHNQQTSEEDLVLDTYSHIISSGNNDFIIPGNASDSKVMEALTETDLDKIMPPPPQTPLTQQQIDLVRRWIDEGAENNSQPCPTNCDTTTYTFAAGVQPILGTYCVGCHGGTAPQGGINLTTYAGVLVVASNGKLVGSVNHLSGVSPMPQNAAMLSVCKRVVIKKWVDAGAFNN